MQPHRFQFLTRGHVLTLVNHKSKIRGSRRQAKYPIACMMNGTGRIKKPKGGLVIDTAAGLKKGGKEHGDKNIVPGKATESRFYVVTTLPISDEYFMPPEGKADPLTDAEKELLKKWIDEGANFGAWTAKTK